MYTELSVRSEEPYMVKIKLESSTVMFLIALMLLRYIGNSVN